MWPFRTISDKSKHSKSERQIRAEIVSNIVDEIENEINLRIINTDFRHTMVMLVETRNYKLYGERANMKYEVVVDYSIPPIRISYWQYLKINSALQRHAIKKIQKVMEEKSRQ